MSSSNDPKSVGDLLRGDGSNGGQHWVTRDGTKITVGPAKDPAASGGKYISVNPSQGTKTTVTFDKGGNVVKKH